MATAAPPTASSNRALRALRKRAVKCWEDNAPCAFQSVFHAERNPTGSSFKLTLSGFENSPTECTPICGDGIVSLGEECDDGKNDGGYGECAPGCVQGPRCGDGIVQHGEDCD